MEMSIRERLLNFVDVIIRVPPLFVIDELLKIDFGLTQESTESLSSTVYTYAIDANAPTLFQIEPFDVKNSTYKIFLIGALKFLCCALGCMAAVCTFMLRTKHLIKVYLYLISMGVIVLSHWSNTTTMKAILAYVTTHESETSILDDILSLDIETIMYEGPGLFMIQNYVLQSLLASIFCYSHQAPKQRILQTLLVLSFMSPSFLGIYPLPTQILQHAPMLAALLPMAVCNFVLWYNSITILRTIRTGYQHTYNYFHDYGFTMLAETEWTRLNVPSVLRTFWLLRAGRHVVRFLTHRETFTFLTMLTSLLTNGCETLTAVLGMTSIISIISYYIGRFFQWVLLTEDVGDNSIGTVSAILFYILALQSGLTSLDEDKRLIRLCRNLCLLATAILHFVHNIEKPLLMSLSASYNPALHRHVRALIVCAFLILIPVSLLIYLWTHFTLSTWLLAASVFNIEMVVKVLVSLAIYSLFLIDAYRNAFRTGYRSAFWERLDDFVYIIRSFGNTVEFAFGIILFFNGFWVLVFESGGTIRAIMMCIHAYLNIWCEANAGWNEFMKRRTAVNKINSLPDANAEQLHRLNDVCAICYQEMRNSKITPCNHYFHGDCLRKWLYVQDRCPLCNNLLYKVENAAQNKTLVTAGLGLNEDR